MKKKGYLTFKD